MKTDSELLRRAMNVYDNVHCHSLDEFNEDLNRFTVVKKMLSRYRITNEISTRLVLNHCVILFNVFGQDALDMFLYKIPRELYPMLFPFLLFLNRLSEEFLIQQGVDLDLKILQELKKL
jgi:hypothetical protein